MTDFDTLVISGGAIQGLSLLGAIQSAYDKKQLESISNYVGTSVGSMICYLLAIGYTPIEIIVYLCVNKVIELLKIIDLNAIVTNQCLLSYSIINDCLENMTILKIGKTLTMNELFTLYNKRLICTTYNYTTKKVEYISYENYPDLPCLLAIRFSSNVPFLFDKIKYMDNYFIDGGISDNFPINKGEQIGNRVIGFYLSEYIAEREETNVDYLFSLLQIPLRQFMEYRCSLVSKEKCKLINIKTKCKMFDFNVNTVNMMELFSDGYSQYTN